MDAAQILDALRAQASAENVAGMARYGISSNGTLGVPVSALRKLAKSLGRNRPPGARGAGIRGFTKRAFWQQSLTNPSG